MEKRITIQIPQDLFDKVEREAKSQERDVSKQIRYILNSYYQPKSSHQMALAAAQQEAFSKKTPLADL